MPSELRSKVGIIACSGEELAEGTVTRLAALKVLHELRRAETVTICLPLFLAGGKEDRTFAKLHPTITVDGCSLRCAAHGTETHSAKPAAGIVVSELAVEHGITGIDGRRCLNAAGHEAVRVTAERLAALVDEVMRTDARTASASSHHVAEAGEADAAVGCSCGSGIPVTWLTIAGQSVEVVALPLILEKIREAHGSPSEAATRALVEMVKIYNYVAPDAEDAWRSALSAEYAAYCARLETR